MTAPSPRRPPGSVPVPDPTFLTTEQLLRSISDLEKLVNGQLLALRDITNERFTSVGTQFALVERQRIEQKADTKAAVDAALAAAKEAVAANTSSSEKSITKSETATSEQLKQLNVTFTTANAGLLSNFNDLKDRVGKIEALKQGGQEANTERLIDKNENRMDLAQVMTLVMVLIMGVGVIVTILATRHA